MQANGKPRSGQRELMFVFSGGYQKQGSSLDRHVGATQSSELDEVRANEIKKLLISELKEFGC